MPHYTLRHDSICIEWAAESPLVGLLQYQRGKSEYLPHVKCPHTSVVKDHNGKLWHLEIDYAYRHQHPLKHLCFVWVLPGGYICWKDAGSKPEAKPMRVKRKVAFFVEACGDTLEDIQNDIAKFITCNNYTAHNNTAFKFLSSALIPEPDNVDISYPGDGYFAGATKGKKRPVAAPAKPKRRHAVR